VLLFNFAIGSFRIFVFASLRELTEGKVLYGLLQSLTTVGSLVAVAGLTYLARKRLAGLKRPLILGMLLQSIALLIVGVPAVIALFPAVFILGFGGELLNVSFNSLMQKFIPLESLGTVRGIFDALATLVIPLSQLVFAWLLEDGLKVTHLSSAAAVLAVISAFILGEFLNRITSSA